MQPHDLLDLLKARRLLAIVRGDDPAAVLRSIDVLAEEGVPLIEVSLTGAEAPPVIRKAASTLGADVHLGAGTVLSARDAGAVAVGLGSPLLGDAPHGGDPDGLRRRVRTALDLVAAS